MFCQKCGTKQASHAAFCPSCGHSLRNEAPATAAIPTPYAGFWLRLAAYLLDYIIVTVVSVVLVVIVFFIIGLSQPNITNESMRTMEVWTQLVLSLANVLYFAWMESSPVQGTLGKRAVGIQVTDLHGNRISFGRALGRNFGKLLSIFTLLIGFIMAAFTKKKQALHDVVAQCLVVKKSG